MAIDEPLAGEASGPPTEKARATRADAHQDGGRLLRRRRVRRGVGARPRSPYAAHEWRDLRPLPQQGRPPRGRDPRADRERPRGAVLGSCPRSRRPPHGAGTRYRSRAGMRALLVEGAAARTSIPIFASSCASCSRQSWPSGTRSTASCRTAGRSPPTSTSAPWSTSCGRGARPGRARSARCRPAEARALGRSGAPRSAVVHGTETGRVIVDLDDDREPDRVPCEAGLLLEQRARRARDRRGRRGAALGAAGPVAGPPGQCAWSARSPRASARRTA